jgi:hypothetical protein
MVHEYHPIMFKIRLISECHIGTSKILAMFQRTPHYCNLVMRVAPFIVIGPSCMFAE